MKYLWFALTANFILSSCCAATEIGVSECVFKNQCKNEELAVKKIILKSSGLNGLLDDFELSENLSEVNLTFREIHLKHHKIAFLSVISIARFSNIFVMVNQKSGKNNFLIKNFINAGVINNLVVKDFNNDGDEDVSFDNFPTGTNVTPNKVVLMNLEGTLKE